MIKLSENKRNWLATNTKINSDYIANNSSETAPESTNQVQESIDIVTFSDDKAVIPEVTPLEQPLQGNQQHTDSNSHSIISFMKRPQLLYDGNWEKKVERGYIVDNMDIYIPVKLLTPMLRCKLDGFTSFRATAVLKLQVNSQPFQQGRLILSAIPMPALISPRDDFLLKHPTYIQAINHVQIDISKQTEVSIRVPFISPFNSYDLIDNKFAWARVTVMVYSQLKDLTAGDGNVPLRLWGHFEDVELGMPTSGLQGNPDNDPDPDRFKFAVQQSGRMKEPSPKQVKVAQKSESVGLVDTLGAGVQSVYKTIGDNVPFLKPVTDIFGKMSQAGTGIVGKLLGFLGFCKPQYSLSGMSVLPRPTEYFGNANGIDHSHVLALDFMNNVDFYPGLAGTNCDEMSFDFLKRIPQFVDYFNFTRSTKSGDILFNSWVMPTYFAPGYLRIIGQSNSTTTSAVTCVNDFREMKELQPTVLNYISSAFMYWTGSLVYTFRFVKTDFHSGRVEISFHPFTNTTDEDRRDYTYRLIVDLRENTEVSVSVPYVSPTPWKKITVRNPMSSGKWVDYGPCATGKIMMRAVTPLICANAIVNTEIECLVEVRAGDDYQVQAPCRSGYFPFTAQKRPTMDNIAIQQSGPFALPGTSETRTSAIQGLIPDSITQGSLDIHREDTRMRCSGEVFDNLREIIKRFCFAERFNSFEARTNIISRDAPFYLRNANLLGVRYQGYTDKTPVGRGFTQFTLTHQTTPLNWVSALYAFYRGGMRFKVYVPESRHGVPAVTDGGGTRLVSARLIDITDAPDGETSPNVSAVKRRIVSFMAPTAFEMLDEKGFAEFQMPFYSPVMLCVPWDQRRVSPFDQSAGRVDISFSNEREKITVYVAVAGADDMTFHGFLGVPPVIGLGRINDYYSLTSEGYPNSEASYIDVTRLDVDPTYPITPFTPKENFWQAVDAYQSYDIYMEDLLACPSKVILSPSETCDTTPVQYDGRCRGYPKN